MFDFKIACKVTIFFCKNKLFSQKTALMHHNLARSLSLTDNIDAWAEPRETMSTRLPRNRIHLIRLCEVNSDAIDGTGHIGIANTTVHPAQTLLHKTTYDLHFSLKTAKGLRILMNTLVQYRPPQEIQPLGNS